MQKLAIVQESPILLNREKTIEMAVALVEKAAEGGAELVIFPEAFISGYPAWIWRLRPGGDWGISEELHTRLLNSSVDIDNNELYPLCEAAKKNKITIICGLNERDGKFSRSTIYNTVVIIGEDGSTRRAPANRIIRRAAVVAGARRQMCPASSVFILG